MEHILVVDDDPGFRSLLVAILTGDGFEVDTAGGVAEALRAADRKQYGLVLTDLRMPDGDGVALLKRWRERDETTPGGPCDTRHLCSFPTQFDYCVRIRTVPTPLTWIATRP